VNVSAKDKATSKEQKITIQASGGLSDSDIEAMIKDAETNASEDKARKELIEARNNADGLAYSTEKSLKEYGDKLDAETKDLIESKIKDLKETLENEAATAEDIQAKTELLTEAAAKLGEAIYASSQADAAAGGAEASTETDDKVVDADFEEVNEEDDNKKAG
jgi:molecular chaperone DnaK